MKNIVIPAGHTAIKGKDMGASSKDYIEGVLTYELAKLIELELLKKGIKPIVDTNNTTLRKFLNILKSRVKKDDIVLDLHFNASDNPKASGTETFIPDNFNSNQKQIAQDIVDIVSDITKINKRKGKRFNGVKTESESNRGKLGIFSLSSNTVLLEVGFITSIEDMRKYNAVKHKLAKNIAEYLYEKAEGNKEYVILPGDTLYSISRKLGVKLQELYDKNPNIDKYKIKIGDKIKL